jgi:hypothetical protein
MECPLHVIGSVVQLDLELGDRVEGPLHRKESALNIQGEGPSYLTKKGALCPCRGSTFPKWIVENVHAEGPRFA